MIRTTDDALWWAFATITMVGYGEFYPVTAEGRVIAAILLTAGIGLFGAFSAAIAAWFLVPGTRPRTRRSPGCAKRSGCCGRRWRG